MPRPRAELRGRLRYRGCGPGPRLSLLHVRLSAAAARALRGCGRRQGEPGPVIAFQGSQGCLTVPGDPGTPPRLFAFSLSRCGRDEPRGSFECVRLAEPRLGQSWLDSLGSIREKITVCAWESTHSPLREHLSLAKEPCSRAVVEPDPAVLGYGKGIAASEKVGVTGLLGKGSVCRVHVPTTASPRASRQSLAQPRAPQPHPEHKLEGMPAGRPGRAQLLAVPEEVQVVGMDPAACCCHGKGTPVGRAQEDWLVTMVQERQQDALLQHSSHAGELESPRSEEERGDGWEESAPRSERHLSVPRDARPQATSSSLAEVPDYLWYRTVCSSEQRRAYEAAFSADYGEYRDLHARVGSVSRRFIQLGAKMKTLKQGTKERKARGRPGAGRRDAATLRLCSPPPFGFQALEAAIVHEYRHFKKTYPSYQQDKNRCEYLHQKLSHIKSLILQFEGSGSN
ncbi:RNA polymerase II elongation factor ELL3 [Numenius arquata]|uniref:RNA polymerase II elongation factor ELL3 n=1 Tax=Numenius arquata TaxID=31919 RepID=UPI003D30C9E2